jgi:hypothetical protein
MSDGVEKLPIAELDTPAATRLADLVSVLDDLTYCADCCVRLEGILKDGPEDVLLQRALWISALVAYARCFASGVRVGIAPDVYREVDGDPLSAHQAHMDMRNKHIAHSVNAFEQVKVGVVLAPLSADKRGVEGVARLSMAFQHGSADVVEQLRLLAQAAGEEVRKRCGALEVKVLRESRQMSLVDLYSRATPRAVVPGAGAIGSRR